MVPWGFDSPGTSSVAALSVMDILGATFKLGSIRVNSIRFHKTGTGNYATYLRSQPSRFITKMEAISFEQGLDTHLFASRAGHTDKLVDFWGLDMSGGKTCAYETKFASKGITAVLDISPKATGAALLALAVKQWSRDAAYKPSALLANGLRYVNHLTRGAYDISLEKPLCEQGFPHSFQGDDALIILTASPSSKKAAAPRPTSSHRSRPATGIAKDSSSSSSSTPSAAPKPILSSTSKPEELPPPSQSPASDKELIITSYEGSFLASLGDNAVSRHHLRVFDEAAGPRRVAFPLPDMTGHDLTLGSLMKEFTFIFGGNDLRTLSHLFYVAKSSTEAQGGRKMRRIPGTTPLSGLGGDVTGVMRRSQTDVAIAWFVNLEVVDETTARKAKEAEGAVKIRFECQMVNDTTGATSTRPFDIAASGTFSDAFHKISSLQDIAITQILLGATTLSTTKSVSAQGLIMWNFRGDVNKIIKTAGKDPSVVMHYSQAQADHQPKRKAIDAPTPELTSAANQGDSVKQARPDSPPPPRRPSAHQLPLLAPHS